MLVRTEFYDFDHFGGPPFATNKWENRNRKSGISFEKNRNNILSLTNFYSIFANHLGDYNPIWERIKKLIC